MAGVFEYIIQMQDRASGTLQKLTGTSSETVEKLTRLQSKTKSLEKSTKDFGGSIYNLKSKIDILQQEKELINPANLTQIRKYNKEINNLSKQVENLENTTGGKFKKYAKDAFSNIPGANLISNPLVLAGATAAGVGKMAVNWEEGMAKINATAQLPQEELKKLSNKLKNLGMDTGANLGNVPDAYEKIISQTGDVSLSTDILDKALKGAKAGFTDVNVVSGAVAQSLSAIGKENTNAQEVLDTLFAAKRVGAGEFADFANYIPSLAAAGNNIGVNWKETAGLFSYMTGKGQEAASASMYIQNAFTALGKSEITDGLKKAGVNVFGDDGKMRSMVDIFTELSHITKSMTDQQKSDFLEKVGLRDMQAKSAFSILTSETDKLKSTLEATGNASGELQAALDNTDNPANRMRTVISKIQGVALTLGGSVLLVLNPALKVLSGLFTALAWVVESIGSAFSWWMGLVQSGHPLIVGLTIVLGGLATAIALSTLWAKKAAIADALWAGEKSLLAIVTGKLTIAEWGLNAALLANPVVLIVVGVMALVGAFIAAWKHSEKFRAALYGMWEVIKGFGQMLKNFVVDTVVNMIKGFKGLGATIGKILKGDFKGAAAEGKEALKNLYPVNSLKNAVESGKQLGKKFKSGYQQGLDDFADEKTRNGYVKDENGKWVKKQQTDIASPMEQLSPEMPGVDIDALMAKFGKGSGSGSKSSKSAKSGQKNGENDLSLGIPTNYNNSNSYMAITAKLGKQPDLAMAGKGETKPENLTERPVKSIQGNVQKMTASVQKMAAAMAVPVAIGVGVANASPNTTFSEAINNNHTINQSEVVNNPVVNSQDNAIYNAADNRVYESTQKLTNITEKVNNVSTSIADNRIDNNNIQTAITNAGDNYDNSRIDNRSSSLVADHSTTNQTYNQGRTVQFDRFTDKIEINVTGAEKPEEVAERVREEVERVLSEVLNV